MSAAQADVYIKRQAVDEKLDPRQTESKLSLALNAIVNGKSHAEKSVGSYLDVLQLALTKLPVIQNRENAFDEDILASIDGSKELVNEYRTLVVAIAKADSPDRFLPQFTRFLEGVLEAKKHYEFDESTAYLCRDPLSFVVREVFLSTVASLCAAGCWPLVQGLINHSYSVGQSNRSFTYHAFDSFQRSLDVFRNRRLNLKRASVAADVLKARIEESALEFENVMQADFILHIHSLLQSGSSREVWFARTLGHAEEQLVSGFDAFVSAKEGESNDLLKRLFDVADWSQLQARLGDAANTAIVNFPESLDYQGFIAANTDGFDH